MRKCLYSLQFRIFVCFLYKKGKLYNYKEKVFGYTKDYRKRKQNKENRNRKRYKDEQEEKYNW